MAEFALCTEMLNQYFTDVSTFGIYLENMPIFLPKYIQYHDDQQILAQLLPHLLDFSIRSAQRNSLDVCMREFNRILQHQSDPFRRYHDNLLDHFFHELQQQQIADMEISATESVEITVSRDVTVSCSEMVCEPVPFVPSVRPIDNNIEVFVDGLNFMSNVMKTLSTNQSSLGYMDVDRKVSTHQFDSLVEIGRALDNAKQFFDLIVPAGSKINLSFKKFGTNEIWAGFQKIFKEKFFDNKDVKHIYDYYVAKPVNIYDTECDDRLTVRLALKAWRENKKVFVISNDKYRSMSDHWNNPSKYSLITKFGVEQRSIGVVWRDIDHIRSLPIVKFDFWTEKCQNPEVKFACSTEIRA